MSLVFQALALGSEQVRFATLLHSLWTCILMPRAVSHLCDLIFRANVLMLCGWERIVWSAPGANDGFLRLPRSGERRALGKSANLDPGWTADDQGNKCSGEAVAIGKISFC